LTGFPLQLGASGAALAACLAVAGRIERGVIVTIFPDGGARYLSERFWDEGRRARPRIRVPREVAEKIRDHGRETYPDDHVPAW